MTGERSPIWDSAASGTWVGLRLDTTWADLARAVFEGVAFGLRQIRERADQAWGWRPQHMLCVGGGASNRTWLQIKADVLGGIAAGVYTGVDDPRLPQARAAGSEPVQPGSPQNRRRYDDDYGVYQSLYPALRDAMHAIAR